MVGILSMAVEFNPDYNSISLYVIKYLNSILAVAAQELSPHWNLVSEQSTILTTESGKHASADALLMGILVVLTFASVPTNVVHGCSINVVNNCPYGVTACAQSGGDPISQYLMVPGATQLLDFGNSCQWLAGAVWASVTGQCANPVGTNAATDRNLANLAEFTIGPGSGVDTYDLSNVNAYTIGLRISIPSVVGGDGGPASCKPSISCVIDDISSFCQGDNQLMTQPSSALSCVNLDGPNAPAPTSNTELFKAACPDAYSYVHDDPSSTFTCGTGSDYQVTFCLCGQHKQM